MSEVVFSLIGFGLGWFCAYLILETKRKNLTEQERRQRGHAEQLRQADRTLGERRQALDTAASQYQTEKSAFDARVVSYTDLQNENLILKRDVRNTDLNLRKLQLDRDQQRQQQHALDERSNALAQRYLHDNVDWINRSLTPNNFSACKKRLQDAVERSRGIGFSVTPEQESELQTDLKDGYAKEVRAALQREEQARIKAQLREELAREREVARILKQLENEREAIKAALQKALAEADDKHSAEVQRLQAQLADAEERSKRAVAQAQLTKAGHVYVISNIGSFGEGVFKIGMTRRLEPNERVDELGSASVPFPFDVHMMISSNDAPTLETTLHRKLSKLKINRANPRKEFFKTDLESIIRVVKDHHGEVEYIAEPEALEYRQTLSMPEEDREFVESVYDAAFDEDQAAAIDEL